MKQLFVIITFLYTALNYAVNDPIGNISGRIIDIDLNEPIPYASIIIKDTAGNLVSGNTSNDDGTFLINRIEPGDYNFQVQFIGYRTFRKEITISKNNSTVELGVIALEPELAMLDDVTVIAERSTIEQRIDRKVINVGKDLTTSGATAADIMNNVPSVNVDQDGNIALRGNSNVRILVDGKPTNMDPSQLLKQIPSTSIKSIELITNPSAKYNPEGMSGIINIVLHKNASDGFNANLNTGVTIGENTRYNGSLDLNYRTGKVNFFGNLGTQGGKNYNLGRIYLPEEEFLQAFDLINQRESYLYKIGMDFYLNDSNTFSFYTNQNHFQGGPEGIFRLLYNQNPEFNLNQNLNFNFDNLNSTYNFVYDHKFREDDHKIQLEVNYNNFEEEQNSQFSYAGNTEGYVPYADYRNEERQDLTTNLDYTNTIGENGKLELGAETRLLETDNGYNTTSPALENIDYQYQRDIYSFYTTYGQNFANWSYQLGARLENFTVDAVANGVTVFEDEYFNVYPSGFLNFTPNETNSYQLSFSRRIDRPGFGQVSPIREVSTPRLTVVGNPSLDPQFTNSVELNYTRNMDNKGSFTAGVFYRNINNEINQVVIEDSNEPGSLILMFDNFEDNNSYGLELSTNYKFTQWWNTNSSFEVYNQKLKGIVGTEYMEQDNTAFTLRTNHSFKATRDLTFQLFGLYRGKNKDLQMDMEPMYFINIGARYSLFNDNATLSLNFNDVFNTQEFEFTNGRPLPQQGRFKGESQTVYLGFSYRFGSGKNAALKRKNRDDNEAQGGGMF